MILRLMRCSLLIEEEYEPLTELTLFKDGLERGAALGYDPDLNDGVVLNIAQLRELVPWRDAEKSWDELTRGKSEWSTMS